MFFWHHHFIFSGNSFRGPFYLRDETRCLFSTTSDATWAVGVISLYLLCSKSNESSERNLSFSSKLTLMDYINVSSSPKAERSLSWSTISSKALFPETPMMMESRPLFLNLLIRLVLLFLEILLEKSLLTVKLLFWLVDAWFWSSLVESSSEKMLVPTTSFDTTDAAIY